MQIRHLTPETAIERREACLDETGDEEEGESEQREHNLEYQRRILNQLPIRYGTFACNVTFCGRLSAGEVLYAHVRRKRSSTHREK